MTPQDMVIVLEKLGFSDLRLQKTEGLISTFKFSDASIPKLRKALGEPTVTADKKVAIFQVPNVGRLGIAPSTKLVKVIANAGTSKITTNSTHLGKTEIPEAYVQALEKAKVTPSLRLAWMAKMWEWFNTEKFGGRMRPPKFDVVQKGGSHKTSRGVYYGGPAFSPGRLYLAPFLFNARAPFILEILLHEMCHQAVWTLDRHLDNSGTQGHGPHWQAWMTRVGLDPRRFDPTEDTEYMSKSEALENESLLNRRYGKRVPDSFWADKHLIRSPEAGSFLLRYKERALPAYTRKVGGKKWEFKVQTPSGPRILIFAAWPETSVYKESK